MKGRFGVKRKTWGKCVCVCGTGKGTGTGEGLGGGALREQRSGLFLMGECPDVSLTQPTTKKPEMS